MNGFKKYVCLSLILSVFIIGYSAVPVHALEMSISGQTMTLKADNIPLRIILARLAGMGISVKSDPSVNHLVSANFKDKSINDAFDRILGKNSHALVWKKDGQGSISLSQVIIHQQGNSDEALLKTISAGLVIETDPTSGSMYVKNRMLIQFRQPVDPARIRAILEKLNANMTLMHEGMGIYEITLPDGSSMADARTAFEKVAGVVEPDYAYQSPAPVRYATDYQVPPGESGDVPAGAVPVAIIDSGLNPDFLAQDLNFASFDALNPGETISDSAGHGTQMALIASGQVDPLGGSSEGFSNPVLSIRGFDENGYTSNTILIKSIDFAIGQGARVLSLSWGSETDSAFLKQAMTYARARGLKIVAAAGNKPTGQPVYPAAYDSVISVSALGPDGKTWDQSNHGDFVDISAPGFANLPIGHNGDPGTYAGTSIAAAYAAGKIAAYLREHPEKEAEIEKLYQ